MATEAATGQPANVQAYLDKHKISLLFEDLTSLLVKDLPDNPIEFLIAQLQAKKKKLASSGSKSTVAGKSKPTSTVTRPTSGKSTGTAAAGIKRPTTTRPTTTVPLSTKSTTGTAKPTAAATSSTSAAAKKTTTVTKPTGLKKPSTTSTAASKSTTSANKSSSGSKLPSKMPTPSTTPRKPASATPVKGNGSTPTKLPKASAKKTPSTGSPMSADSPSATRKTQQQMDKKPAVVKPLPAKPEILEETKRVDAHTPSKDDLDDEIGVTITTTGGSKKEEEESDSEEETEAEKETAGETVPLQDIIVKIKKGKHPNKHGQDKTHIAKLIKPSAATTSEGYISDSDGDDTEALEVIENIADLEAEGVYLDKEARKIALKLPEARPNIDLKVQVCSRCAKILTRDDETTAVSSSTSLVSKLTSIDEFESASQVTTSGQTSFPQWDSDVPLTSKQKWSTPNITNVPVTSSVVTSSDETVLPPTHSQVDDKESEPERIPTPVAEPNDDKESEPERIPTPVAEPNDDKESEPERIPTPVAEPNDDKESEPERIPTPVDEPNDDKESEPERIPTPVNEPNDDEVTLLSDDTWNGIAPVPRPQVPPSEDSELILPDPVDYHKPDDDDSDATTAMLINIED